MTTNFQIPEKAFVIPIQTRFRDTDMMGHMNHAVLITYLETARVEWIKKNQMREGNKLLPIIIARVEMDYHKPVFMSSKPNVATWVSHIGTKSFTLSYAVYEDIEGGVNLFATSKTIIVYFDYEENKSTEISTKWLKLLQDMLVE
jgi:acyl-CoA thioester hydrolase